MMMLAGFTANVTRQLKISVSESGRHTLNMPFTNINGSVQNYALLLLRQVIDIKYMYSRLSLNRTKIATGFKGFNINGS